MQAGSTYKLACITAEVCNCMYCGVQCYYAASIEWLKHFWATSLLRATNPYPTTI